MDGKRFDAITRGLGGVTSRRTALKALFGGVIGGAIATVAIDVEDAAATCGYPTTRCNRNQACCSGTCEWTTTVRGRRRYRTGACTCVAESATGCRGNDRLCCGNLLCEGNSCVECRSDAALCENSSECCSGICYEGICVGAPTCNEYGSICALPDALPCCAGMSCNPGAGTCKISNGESCSMDNPDACDSGCCIYGTCGTPHQVANGAACWNDCECAEGYYCFGVVLNQTPQVQGTCQPI